MESGQTDPGADGHSPPRAGKETGRGSGGAARVRPAGKDLYERSGPRVRNHRDHRRTPESDRPGRTDTGSPGVQLWPLGGADLQGDRRAFCGRVEGVAPGGEDRKPHRRRGFHLPAEAGRPCLRYGGQGGENRPHFRPQGAAAGDPLSRARARCDLPEPLFRDELLAFGDRVPPGAPAAAHPFKRHLPPGPAAPPPPLRRGFDRMTRGIARILDLFVKGDHGRPRGKREALNYC